MKFFLYSLLILATTTTSSHGLTQEQLREATNRYIEFIIAAGKTETPYEWCCEQINKLYATNCRKETNQTLMYTNRNEFIDKLADIKAKNLRYTIEPVPKKQIIQTTGNTVTIFYTKRVPAYDPITTKQVIFYDEDCLICEIIESNFIKT